MASLETCRSLADIEILTLVDDGLLNLPDQSPFLPTVFLELASLNQSLSLNSSSWTHLIRVHFQLQFFFTEIMFQVDFWHGHLLGTIAKIHSLHWNEYKTMVIIKKKQVTHFKAFSWEKTFSHYYKQVASEKRKRKQIFTEMKFRISETNVHLEIVILSSKRAIYPCSSAGALHFYSMIKKN